MHYKTYLHKKFVNLKNLKLKLDFMKIRRKKKVVFRVIGNHLIGLGHVYRSLSIAREDDKTPE